MNLRKNSRAGVTLIEMLVVVVIIAVLAAVVGPRLLNQGDKARVVAARQQLELQLALGQYHLDTGGYPSTEQGLAALRVQPTKPIMGCSRRIPPTILEQPGLRPRYPRSWR